MRCAIILAIALGSFADDLPKPEEEAAKKVLAEVEKNPDPAILHQYVGFDRLPAEVRSQVVELLRANLERDPDLVETPTDFGWPRLHLAAFRGQVDIVRLLLDFKAPMVAEIEDDRARVKVPALLAAVGVYHPPLYESGEPSVAVVELLLSRGADPNVAATSGRFQGMTALDAAASGSGPIVRSLLDHGADPNSKDDLGRTPLHHATSVEVASFLLEAGASPDAPDATGWTPLDCTLYGVAPSDDVAAWLVQKGQPLDLVGASALGRADLVAELLSKDPSALDRPGRFGGTALFWAAARGREEVVALLLEKGANPNVRDNDGDTPLLIAVRLVQEGVAARLLDKGADPNAVDIEGRTPILIATQQSANVIVERLIDKGADVKRPGPQGEAALHLAADGADVELVATLIAAGADVNATRKNGDTPLLVAISYLHRPRNLGVVEALLLAGADPNVVGSSQRTPLDLSADVPEFAELLRKHGAKQ